MRRKPTGSFYLALLTSGKDVSKCGLSPAEHSKRADRQDYGAGEMKGLAKTDGAEIVRV